MVIPSFYPLWLCLLHTLTVFSLTGTGWNFPRFRNLILEGEVYCVAMCVLEVVYVRV